MADNKTDENVEVTPCPFCGSEPELVVRDFTDDKGNVGNAYIRCVTCCIEQPYRVSEAEAVSAWNQRHQPQEREAVLQKMRSDVFDALRRHNVSEQCFAEVASITHAALTTPAPADGTDPEDHSGQKLRETVDQELTRIEKRNSGRDQAPAFDRELARNVILAAFGLFDCPKDTTASGYQWMRLLTLLGLDKTAPAVSTDEIVAVLETAKDYFSDAAKGALTYEGSGDGFKAMAKEDLDRLSAILSRLRPQ